MQVSGSLIRLYAQRCLIVQNAVQWGLLRSSCTCPLHIPSVWQGCLSAGGEGTLRLVVWRGVKCFRAVGQHAANICSSRGRPPHLGAAHVHAIVVRQMGSSVCAACMPLAAQPAHVAGRAGRVSEAVAAYQVHLIGCCVLMRRLVH